MYVRSMNGICTIVLRTIDFCFILHSSTFPHYLLPDACSAFNGCTGLYTRNVSLSASVSCDLMQSNDCINKCCSLLPNLPCTTQYATSSRQCADIYSSVQSNIFCVQGYNCSDSICCRNGMQTENRFVYMFRVEIYSLTVNSNGAQNT